MDKFCCGGCCVDDWKNGGGNVAGVGDGIRGD